MKAWLEENRENLIVAGIAAAVIAILLTILYFSGYGFWITVALGGLVKLLFFVLGIAFIALPLLPGYFAPKGADALDESLGKGETSKGMKAFLIVIVGIGLSVAYVFLVNLMTYVPQLAAIYPGDVAMINEVPLSAWGWILWGFVAYLIGWGYRYFNEY